LTVTKGRFLGHFDNALLLVYRNTPALRQRIDQFVYNSCRWMTADSRLSSGLAEPLRLDVYQDSFAKMSRLMRDPQFTFERSAGVFLRRLYRDRCIDAIRHRDTLKESQGRQNADLEGLSERARRKLSQPPFELVDDMLNLVKRKYPRCFALLRRLDEGYSYEELSHEFGKLAGALRKEAYRCRQKLYNYSQSLGYDG
jgi:DNA-directed RNA polymerase specialized sigma24 family protein